MVEVSQSPPDLCGDVYLPENQIQITSLHFNYFNFIHIKSSYNGDYSKTIIISAMQWTEMINKYNTIAAAMSFYLNIC